MKQKLHSMNITFQVKLKVFQKDTAIKKVGICMAKVAVSKASIKNVDQNVISKRETSTGGKVLIQMMTKRWVKTNIYIKILL